MEQNHERPPSSRPLTEGLWSALLADAPWKAKSFMAAGAATAGGVASWLGDMTSPAVARMGASYLGGFLIGWLFHRFLKIAAIAAGIALACIGALKGTGWIDLDWAAVEQQINDGMASLHHGAEGLKELLSGYLPSAGAAGAGSFFGFRKK